MFLLDLRPLQPSPPRGSWQPFRGGVLPPAMPCTDTLCPDWEYFCKLRARACHSLPMMLVHTCCNSVSNTSCYFSLQNNSGTPTTKTNTHPDTSFLALSKTITTKEILCNPLFSHTQLPTLLLIVRSYSSQNSFCLSKCFSNCSRNILETRTKKIISTNL